jgi:hypothetical protein
MSNVNLGKPTIGAWFRLVCWVGNGNNGGIIEAYAFAEGDRIVRGLCPLETWNVGTYDAGNKKE